MIDSDKVLLKVSCPKWFLVVLPAVLVFSLLLFILMWVHFGQDGFTWPEVWGMAIFLAILAGWLWLIPFLYSSIIATDSGLRVTGLLGRNLNFTWDTIVKVSRPLLGIPREFIYVFSKSGDKMVLLRSMERYSDLLKLIETRAPNLSPKTLPQEMWLQKLSWGKTWLAIIGILIIYMILKVIFKW